MKNNTGKMIAAVLMFAGTQIAAAGGSKAYGELGGLAISAGIPAFVVTDTNIPAPDRTQPDGQMIQRYDLLLKEGKISKDEYDSLVAGLRDLANMEALAAGRPVPYPGLMPSEPQHLTSVQKAARYKKLFEEGKISRGEYDWLMGGLNDLDQTFKSGQASALDIGNRAHKTVWTTLRVTGQLDTVFFRSGNRKIAGFPVWREGNSARASQQLADRLDGVFVGIRGAKRNIPGARQTLAGLLTAGRDGGKDVRWLADRIDELYTFWKE